MDLLVPEGRRHCGPRHRVYPTLPTTFSLALSHKLWEEAIGPALRSLAFA